MTARRFPRRARRASGDDGVTLILIAVAISALLIVAAIVIDLSIVRDTRQSNKSVADTTVAAGMRGLANNNDGVPKPWGGVCKAIDYFQLNHPDGASLTGTFRNGAGTAVSNPCNTSSSLYGSSCAAGDNTTWAWYDGSADGGRVQVDIKNGYATPDADFPEDTAAYAGDNNTTPLGACGQLAVIIREVDPEYFGGVGDRGVANPEYASVIRSVGRVTVGEQNPVPVALLLLEKTACRTLFTEGNNTFVLVRSSTNNRPGFIQVNSTGADCGGGSRVIEGSSVCPALTNCVGSGPSIVAQDALTVKGVVGNHALGGPFASFANTSSCADPATPTAGCTLGPDPLDRGIVNRSPVDNRYLARVTALQSTASNAAIGANGDPSFYQVPNNGACNNLQGKTISATLPASATVINTGGLTKVYIHCNFDTGSNLTTRFDETITDVVARGTMDVGSNGMLRLDGVRRFYVGGGTGNGMNIQGTLWVNGGSVPDTCTTRRLNAPSLVTEMVISNGRLTGGAAGAIHLCNTFLFLADGNLPTTAGTDPADHNYNGGISFGAQNTLDWTAPNQTELLVPSADPVYDKFEDLALWTESGNCANVNNPPTGIGGQGSVTATGVFFLPNACFNVAGGGFGASIGADAQFIVRRFAASGTTQLSMAPNPANVVPIPFFESFRLVR